jgi:hypothetical protein
MLNSTLMSDKKDFRNPTSELTRSTFGNPNLNDKFFRKKYEKEYAREVRGKIGPSPVDYHGDILRCENMSSFYKGPREERR